MTPKDPIISGAEGDRLMDERYPDEIQIFHYGKNPYDWRVRPAEGTSISGSIKYVRADKIQRLESQLAIAVEALKYNCHLDIVLNNGSMLHVENEKIIEALSKIHSATKQQDDT